MRFVDEVIIHVRAGDGGHGSNSIRRAKGVPFGGPDGGDGGQGGSIILEARHDTNTLLELRYQQRYTAKNGVSGQGRLKTGLSAEDVIVRVPVGTLVSDADTGQILGDMTTEHQRLVVAAGGRGGRGNVTLTQANQRIPSRAEEGTEGVERRLQLELKLIADVALIGFPNAGKSTLISRISAARPKIADYPFTTLVPNLGVVRVSDERSFVVADIPGLIEGASQGAGLGLKFLRHIERTRVFLHLLSVAGYGVEGYDERSPLERYHVINRELEAYDPSMMQKPQLILLTQIDALYDRAEQLPALLKSFEAEGRKVYAISSVTGEGIRELIFDLAHLLEQSRLADDPQ